MEAVGRLEIAPAGWWMTRVGIFAAFRASRPVPAAVPPWV
jgi:hypothetical protein